MPILIDTLRGRNKVGWFKKAPSSLESEPFVKRRIGIEFDAVEASAVLDPITVSTFSAIIFEQEREKPLRVVREIESHGRLLLSHGVMILVRSCNPEIKATAKSLDNIGFPVSTAGGEATPPCIYYCGPSMQWDDIANTVERFADFGSVNTALRLDGPTTELCGEEVALLQRAFSDCERIVLTKCGNPRSGAKTYRVFADTLSTQGLLALSAPQLRFVKIDTRANTECEYKNYEQRVHPYIPFYLGPHLDSQRCSLGCQRGILVSAYVDESESLMRCSEGGRGTAAIACLFDRTLANWYRHAVAEPNNSMSSLRDTFPTGIPEDRLELARTLGLMTNLQRLRSLFQRSTDAPLLVGHIHGDLHLNNILVRSGDAVLVDYANVERKPLLLEVATLEVSLVIEAFLDDKTVTDTDWFDISKGLYTSDPLDHLALWIAPEHPLAYLCQSVRQVRDYARRWQCKDGQYAAALAFAFMQKADRDRKASGSESFRRAAAIVFAELILRRAFERTAGGET
jgi:hypothetical protein